MKPPQYYVTPRPKGTAILVILMILMVCTMGTMAWLHLLAARTQQVESMVNTTQRHVAWANSRAVNQQYSYMYTFRDNVTRSTSTTATTAGWGGLTATGFSALKAMRSGVRPSTGTMSFPFMNLAKVDTPDNGVFAARTLSEYMSSQTGEVRFFNYIKSYPTPLMGDLLILHKKPGTAAYQVSQNIQVNGRVVIMDETVNASGVRAKSCLNLTPMGENSTRQIGSSAALMPQNFQRVPRITAGGDGTGIGYPATTTASAASVDGSLNMVSNSRFKAGSVSEIMAAVPTSGRWVKVTAGSAGTPEPGVEVKHESYVPLLGMNPTYPPPTSSAIPTPPYIYTSFLTLSPGTFRVVYVHLNKLTKHLKLTSDSNDDGVQEPLNAMTQIVLVGATDNGSGVDGYDYGNNLEPVIIWVDQPDVRDIRFVGQSCRRVILATKGAGSTIYCGFHPTAIPVGSAEVDWRIQWINENRPLWMNPNSSMPQVRLTGSIRTDSSLNVITSGSTVNLFIDPETAPSPPDSLRKGLLDMLPRDAWLEPFFVVE